jgi:hypothetical protein
MSLQRNRNTQSKECRTVPPFLPFRVKGGALIYAGALIALKSGVAAPGTVDSGLRCIGRATDTVDNTNGADGDKTTLAEGGIFLWDNYDSDRITLSDVGSQCYIIDDQTVAKTDGGGTRSAAGSIIDVCPAGVWVACRLTF